MYRKSDKKNDRKHSTLAYKHNTLPFLFFQAIPSDCICNSILNQTVVRSQ